MTSTSVLALGGAVSAFLPARVMPTSEARGGIRLRAHEIPASMVFESLRIGYAGAKRADRVR